MDNRLPPRYAFRLEDLRVWHLVRVSCRMCRHKLWPVGDRAGDLLAEYFLAPGCLELGPSSPAARADSRRRRRGGKANGSAPARFAATD